MTITLLREMFSEPEEIYVGACFGMAWIAFLGWWSILAAVCCGLLWRLGGWRYGHKLFRRVGVPVVMLGLLWITGHWNVSPLVGIALYGVLSCGYGMPDPVGTLNPDPGSPIGRFWSKHLEIVPATVMTRATVSLMAGLCFIQLGFTHPMEYYNAVWAFIIGHVLVERLV